MREDLRMILGLDSTLAVYLVLDTFSIKTFLNLFHGGQVQDSTVGHNHDLLGSHVLKVHANLLGTARTEANARCCHLECILFLLRIVDRCRKSTSSLRDTQRIVMVSRVAVAWTSWTVCAYCTQEVECSHCSGWCYAYGRHCDRYEARKKMQNEESKASRGHVLTCIIERVLRGCPIAGLEQIGYTAEPAMSLRSIYVHICITQAGMGREICHADAIVRSSCSAILSLSFLFISAIAPLKQKPRHNRPHNAGHVQGNLIRTAISAERLPVHLQDIRQRAL